MDEKAGRNKSSFGKKLACVIIGYVFALSAVVLLFWEEAMPSAYDAVKSAAELTAENTIDLENKAVWFEGRLHSQNRATDSEYILVSDCIVLRRNTYTYTEHETSHEDSDGYTTYTYSYSWDVSSRTLNVANDLKIGGFEIADNLELNYSDMPILDLSGHVNAGYTLNSNYIYLKSNRGSVTNPSVGDTRISYNFIKNESDGLVIARLSGTALAKLDYGTPPFQVSVYEFYYKGEFAAIQKALQTKNSLTLWLSRAAGLLLTVTGTALILLCFFDTVWRIRVRNQLLISLAAAVLLAALSIISAHLINSIYPLLVLLSVVLLTVIPIIIALRSAQKPRRE